MARPTAYLFCRYQIVEDETPLTANGEWRALEKVRGKPIAYRKKDPTPDDKDTYLMKPRKKDISGYTVHTWEIVQDIKYRERSKYNISLDEITDEMVETEEIRHTKFLSIPRLGVFAVDDSINDRSLGARSAVKRFCAVVETLIEDSEVNVDFAGTPEDAQRALNTWTLDQFSFTVRPFNPTPRKLGETMHELMVKDHVGSLRAIALPMEGEQMRDSHHGLISEAKGLSEAGYGQYGAKGTTPDGLQASLGKPNFTLDKEKNIQAQTRNRILKVDTSNNRVFAD